MPLSQILTAWTGRIKINLEIAIKAGVVPIETTEGIIAAEIPRSSELISRAGGLGPAYNSSVS